MRILGVDPGIATVGFAVLDADKRSQRLLTCGVITTPAKTQLSSRLDQIYRDLNELIAQFHPEAMAVEELFFNTNHDRHRRRSRARHHSALGLSGRAADL